ncbi:MAG: glycosyltransferase family 39 protein [Gammaproteobacteria bacterium]|nr:glycosyltransferase family 39 protein [Gammaproteobacteria bacterium]
MTTENIAGLILLLLGAVMTLGFMLRYRSISLAVLLAFASRAASAMLHTWGLISLPGHGADTNRFWRHAQEWAALPPDEFWALFDPTTSLIYSWFGALLFRVTVTSELMLAAVNVLLGTFSVLLTYIIARRLMPESRARLLTWLMALYPTLVIHSGILLREMAVVAPFMVGVYYAVRWAQEDRPLDAALAVTGFAVATVFHGGMVGAIIALGLFGIWRAVSATSLTERTLRWRSALAGSVGAVLVFTAAGYAFVGGWELGSIGAVDDRILGLEQTLEDRSRVEEVGGSDYPAAIRAESMLASPWVLPGRVLYFLYSPFPWDIRAPTHLLGLLPSALFFYVTFSAWKGRREIIRRPELLLILLIVVMLTIMFAVGTTNIGTAMRHKAKFVHALVLLAVVPVWRSYGTQRALRTTVPRLSALPATGSPGGG